MPSITRTLAARLSGNWVSTLLFRRCLSSIAEKLFGLSVGLGDGESDELVPLDRSTAQELVLLSIFVPFMASNIAAKCCPEIIAFRCFQ